MSSPELLQPLFAALGLGILVTGVHRRMRPDTAARLMVATIVVITMAAVPTFVLLALAYLAHLPLLGQGFEWCAKALDLHDPISPWIGLPALSLTGAAIRRAPRVIRSFRDMRVLRAGDVAVCERDAVFAVTLPGPGGQIVVSRGLVELLDDNETDVVLAHERAHALYRHDRFFFIARFCNALVPFVAPLGRRLEYSIERWADEAAVSATGDRAFVARTLGKVALSGGLRPAGVLGINRLGVPARVTALLVPVPPAPRRGVVASTWLAVAATAALALVQIHHVAVLVSALCPG